MTNVRKLTRSEDDKGEVVVGVVAVSLLPAVITVSLQVECLICYRSGFETKLVLLLFLC